MQNLNYRDGGQQRLDPADITAAAQSIDLNHATWQELTSIEGVDEALAKSLVEYRTFHGHFLSWEDVQRVPGMGPELAAQVQHSARIGSAETPQGISTAPLAKP